MKHKKKITFILPTLLPGGAEKVISFVAQNLDKSKFDATLLVTGYEKDNHFEIKGIKLEFLEKPRVLKAIPRIIHHLLSQKPEIVVSAIGHLNTVMSWLSIWFKKTKFVAREVNIVSVLKDYSDNHINKLLSSIYNTKYNFFDAIICQSTDMANDLVNNFNADLKKIHIIHNPISNHFVTKEKNKIPESGVINLITVGRLSKQKGYMRVLKALSNLNSSFHYTIIGDGPQKDSIMRLIKDLGLSSKVTHISFSGHIAKHLSNSHIYLQGSYVEGFPNALLESCSVGTPVVVFKALGGINEIVENGVNGFIVNNEEEFINKIEYIYNSFDEWIPRRISKSVHEKYNSTKIMKDYEKLFLEKL